MSIVKPGVEHVTALSDEVEAETTYTEHLDGRERDHSDLYHEGLKLSPTPSDDEDDPLNWPMWLKIAVLTQTSLLAAIGGLNTATINPALVQVAREFNISTVRASYQTTVCIALNGLAPFLWIPLAHRYGRRPIYLITTLLGFISILCCAYTHTYTELLVARIFNGLFPVGFALGATTVVDLFYYHQRGRAMGFFTVTVVNGSHIAPIVGGLLGQYRGWRSIFKFLAIVDGVLFLVALVALPETMYQRRSTDSAPVKTTPPSSSSDPTSTSHETNPELSSTIPTQLSKQPHRTRTTFQTYRYYLRILSFNPNASLRPQSFIIPTLRLFRSPPAVFPAIYYASMYGFASILPAVTVAAIFTRFFHWNTLTIGLTYGGALTAGGVLGEVSAGWVCDFVVQREERKRRSKLKDRDDTVVEIIDTTSNPQSNNTQTVTTTTTPRIPPEIRLLPIFPGAIITPAGLLIYGFTLQYHTHPSLPLIGMALSCFGLQIITTASYTYAIDVHCRDPSHNPAELAQLFNLIRQTFGMTFAFYVVRMGEKIGFQWTFVIFAVCGGVLAFGPVVVLMGKGLGWFGR